MGGRGCLIFSNAASSFSSVRGAASSVIARHSIGGLCVVRTFTDLADAQAAAGDGLVVSGIYTRKGLREELLQTLPDVFFLAPADADASVMQELSYEARFGEPMRSDDRSYLRFLAREAKTA